MILSTKTELNALLPTNVLSEPRDLFTLMEQTERTYIIPVLGKPLYTAVQEEYGKLRKGIAEDIDGNKLEVDDLVATEDTDVSYDYTPMQQLIKLLQVPIVYMTLANNPGLLSVSLNSGGMNTATAEYYEAADKDVRDAFAKDCYLNAHRGIEQVLLFLEEDARAEEPVFLQAWMASSYFYQQNGLLIRTAMEFDRYVPISESRETFLSLVQSIRYFQDNRIRPDIGDTLINAFIQFSVYGPQPKSVNDSDSSVTVISDEKGGEVVKAEAPWDYISSRMISDEAFEEDLRSFLPLRRYEGMTSGERYKLNIWQKALTLLRNALAFFVEDDNKKLKRANSLNDAMSCIGRAKQLIAGNTAAFEGVIEDSPLYSAPELTPEKGQEPPSRICPDGHGYIHDPFETFYS